MDFRDHRERAPLSCGASTTVMKSRNSTATLLCDSPAILQTPGAI